MATERLGRPSSGFDPEDTDGVNTSADSVRRVPPTRGRGRPAKALATREAPVPASTKQRKHVAPSGVTKPDRGWPKFVYRLWCMIGRPDKVPTINQAQANERYREEREAYKASLIERLRELSNLGIAPIMFFKNIKSAGKSSAAIGVGSVVKFHTQKSTLLLPATMNAATATAGQMAGISGNAISVSEFARDLKEFGTARTLEKRLPLTRWGLGVIVEDEYTEEDVDDAQATQEFMDMVDVLLPKVSNLILDGGNDNISRRSLALQAARLSHVFNYVFMADSVITQQTLKKTFMGYWNHPSIPDDVDLEFYQGFEHKSDSGVDTPVREKIQSSVCIATKASAGDEIDFEYYMTPDSNARADSLPKWHGTGLCVPADRSIGRQKADGTLVPFDLDALDLEAYIAYLEIAVANFELAGHQTKVNIGVPMVATIPNKEKEGSVS